ncbi:MAG: D-tyrosyl-tRNA(Tyr) deacylase [Lentisphaeria bacterium]|nr:D-tyrosyl-tRNA(Tyr) deacylase [Lentisphaeria bacterium]
MRVLVQRVSSSSVTIDGECCGAIGAGLNILVGITHSDTEADAKYLAEKCVCLRIFEDEAGKMNRSLLDIGGEALIISQFTLYGDTTQGRRPFFGDAARPEIAEPLYEKFIGFVKASGVKVATGRFGADMKVEIQNDGPVTLMIESK